MSDEEESFNRPKVRRQGPSESGAGGSSSDRSDQSADNQLVERELFDFTHKGQSDNGDSPNRNIDPPPDQFNVPHSVQNAIQVALSRTSEPSESGSETAPEDETTPAQAADSARQSYPQEPRPFTGTIEGDFSDIQRQIIEDAVAEAQEKIDLSSLETITTDHPLGWDDRDHWGQVFNNPDTIWLDEDGIGMSHDFSPYSVSGKHFDLAIDQSRARVFHELMHIAHSQVVRQHDATRPNEWNDAEEAELIEEEVSMYAATHPYEMVAEVGTLLLSGRDVSDEVLDLYRYYAGPEI